MRDYVALARLAEALRAIPHNKVETAARDAGFKSRKDFYRAFKRFTGMTPSAYRNLPRERAQQLLDEATVALDGARPPSASRRKRSVPAYFSKGEWP